MSLKAEGRLADIAHWTDKKGRDWARFKLVGFDLPFAIRVSAELQLPPEGSLVKVTYGIGRSLCFVNNMAVVEPAAPPLKPAPEPEKKPEFKTAYEKLHGKPPPPNREEGKGG